MRCSLATLLIVGLPCQFSVAATSEQIQSAIDRAEAYLYSQQNHDGNWETVPRSSPAKEAFDPAGGQWGGLTCLATYTLLSCGDSYRDARLAPAINFVEKADIRGIYALGLRSQVWVYLPKESSAHLKILADGNLLLTSLHTGGDSAGMYGYLAGQSVDPSHVYDHSVSQYGVLGMWALQEEGLEVPDRYWQIVDAGWRRDQLPDGDWSYFAQPRPGYPSRVTCTAAGVASLLITDDYLRSARGLQCRDDLSDPAVDHGIDWISRHFDDIFNDSTMRACYALYGVERVGAASGRKLFGNVDWYDRGSAFLIEHQLPSGAWDQGDGAVADTALGLLFLNHGRAPVVMNKLDYSSPAEAAGWNDRPRDVSHLARWIGKTIESNRPLNWQVVNFATDSDEWHDAPILFICGKEALRFSRDQEAKLKSFVEEGGMMLFNSDCGQSKAFVDSVKSLGRRLFNQDFQALPPDHPIYLNEEFPRKKWRQTPAILGIGNGAREFMLMAPDADIAAAWQVNTPLIRPEAFQLAADVFLYATDKQNLRNKGDSYLVQADPAAVVTRQIKLARLDDGSDWNPEPGGWRRVAAILHNRDGVDLAVTPVKLGDGSLLTGGYDIAHLTGTSRFPLWAAARNDLRRFVAAGGELVVDAAGGSRAFADSAQNELKEILGADAAQLDTPLPIEHPFYSEGEHKVLARDIQYRDFTRTVLSDLRQPRLRAATMGGRTAVFFSREDLSVGLVGQPVDGIVGYTPETATKLMERMILQVAK